MASAAKMAIAAFLGSSICPPSGCCRSFTVGCNLPKFGCVFWLLAASASLALTSDRIISIWTGVPPP